MIDLGVAVERYIGIFLPLRYQEIVTPGRVKASIAFCIFLPAIFIMPAAILGNVWEPGMPCSMYRVSDIVNCLTALNDTCGWDVSQCISASHSGVRLPVFTSYSMPISI